MDGHTAAPEQVDKQVGQQLLDGMNLHLVWSFCNPL